MTPIGETLRRERNRRSLDLDQISRQTKISVRLLEAIENEQFDKLPGGVFTKSFVKQYARALGLDDEEIGNELDRMLQPVDEIPLPTEADLEQSIKVPRVTEWEGVSRPKDNSSLPALALLVALMLVCSGFYAWWQRARHPAPRETASTSVPAVATPPAEQPSGTTPPSATTSTETKPGAKNTDTSATPPPASQPKPETPDTAPTEAANPPGATTVPPTPAGPIGNPTGSVQVTLKATEPVWVKCWVDGKVMLVTTLQGNESRTLGASGDIRLRVGNAGGLEVALNGKSVGPLGPKGQIREVQLTPKGLEVIPPKPPAPPGPQDIL